MRSAKNTVAIAIVAGMLMCAGCSVSAAPLASTAPESPVPAPSPSGSEVTSTDDAPGVDMADAIAERERFFAEQRIAPGQTLVAVTDAQKEFVRQQREHAESQGAQWSPQSETIILATTLDACETSILNGHEISADRLTVHVGSSPVFDAYTTDSASERGLASIMVFGTRFLCPDDAPQWQAAFDEVYG